MASVDRGPMRSMAARTDPGGGAIQPAFDVVEFLASWVPIPIVAGELDLPVLGILSLPRQPPALFVSARCGAPPTDPCWFGRGANVR